MMRPVTTPCPSEFIFVMIAMRARTIRDRGTASACTMRWQRDVTSCQTLLPHSDAAAVSWRPRKMTNVTRARAAYVQCVRARYKINICRVLRIVYTTHISLFGVAPKMSGDLNFMRWRFRGVHKRLAGIGRVMCVCVAFTNNRWFVEMSGN